MGGSRPGRAVAFWAALLGALALASSASHAGEPPSANEGLVSPPPTLELAPHGALPEPACLTSAEVRSYLAALQQRVAGAWSHPAIWGPIEPVQLSVSFDGAGVRPAGPVEHASDSLGAAVVGALAAAGHGEPPACLVPKQAVLVVLVPYLLPPRQQASTPTQVWEIPVWVRGIADPREDVP